MPKQSNHSLADAYAHCAAVNYELAVKACEHRDVYSVHRFMREHLAMLGKARAARIQIDADNFM